MLESGAVKLSHFVGAELIRCFIRIFVSSKRDELTFTNVVRHQCAAFNAAILDAESLSLTEAQDAANGRNSVIIVLKKT